MYKISFASLQPFFIQTTAQKNNYFHFEFFYHSLFVFLVVLHKFYVVILALTQNKKTLMPALT